MCVRVLACVLNIIHFGNVLSLEKEDMCVYVRMCVCEGVSMCIKYPSFRQCP